MKIVLQIEEKELSALAAYIALGTLQAILTKTVPANVGIWSLGRPGMWEFLETRGISPDLVEVFQTADELELIQRDIPEKIESTITGLLEKVQTVLSQIENPNYLAQWFIEAEPQASIRKNYDEHIKHLLTQIERFQAQIKELENKVLEQNPGNSEA